MVRYSQVLRKNRTVLSTVGLGEQTKIAVVVAGKRIEEGLKEGPHVLRGRIGRAYLKGTVAEADAKGLVKIEHVGDIVPTVLVRRKAFHGVAFEEARAIFLEETSHAAATGPTIKPESQRCRCRISAGLKEPPEQRLRMHQRASTRVAIQRKGSLTLSLAKLA